MKAVDPSIQIGIVGNDFDFHLANSPWNRAVIDGTKGLADFFIAHFYLPGIAGGSIDATRICLASPDRFREKLRSLRKEAGNLDLAITEMACNLGINPENDPKSLSLHRSQQAAVFLADTLLALREAKVAVSNYWTIRGWHWSLIELADKKVIPQVPYLVYKLFADYEQTRFIPAAVRAGSIELDPARKTEFRRPTHPTLVAGGSIDPDQTRLTVFLINRALNNPTTVTVKFTGQTFRPKRCTLRVLAAEPNTVNTAENPSAAKIIDTPVQQIAPNAAKCTLPPCAVAALIWEGEKP